MNRIEELKQLILDLENQIEPIRKELHALIRIEEENVDKRITKAEKGNGDFTPDELIYSAYSRCSCGAGLAYPKNIGMWGAWYCSDILCGNALPSSDENAKQHIDGYPFNMYSIKSENQPSGNYVTTRPTI